MAKRKGKEIVRALGIDLSLVETGISMIDNWGGVGALEVLKSKPIGDRPVDEVVRIATIVSGIEDIIDKLEPHIVCIEGLAFMAKNSTALTQLASLNYHVRLCLYKRGIQFIIIAPTSLKKFITGSGGSQKDVMMMEVLNRYGESIPNNNACDAYCLAQVALAFKGYPSIKITKGQEEVLALLQKQI